MYNRRRDCCFPFLAGRTLEEELDELLEKKQFEALLGKIQSYFAFFSESEETFQMTAGFRRVSEKYFLNVRSPAERFRMWI